MANIKDLIQSIESGDSSFDEKLAAINEMEETLVAMRAQEQSAIDDNVAMIVEAIAVMQRKVEAQLEVAKAIVPEIGPMGPKGAPGERGLDGANGRDGRDGADGRNGVDGQDGVSVTDAKIDFDGSLVITLSTGREINVGEVVAPDLAEKIKLVTSGGSTSQQVLDTLVDLQAQIDILTGIDGTLGTMATQNANAVAITGGTIDNTVIGSTTPAAGTFTTLSSQGQADLGGISGQESLRVITTGSATTPMRVVGTSANAGGFWSTGSISFACGTTQMSFRSAASQSNPSAGPEQLRVSHTASAVNYVQVTGAATGGAPEITVQGSDANANLIFRRKGSGNFQFYGSVYAGNSSANNILLQGAGVGNSPSISMQGSDTNIDLALTPKGTGNVVATTGQIYQNNLSMLGMSLIMA